MNNGVIVNNYTPKHYIQTISEWSCETEDWSNGSWIWHLKNILQHYCFYCIFLNSKISFGKHKSLLSKSDK